MRTPVNPKKLEEDVHRLLPFTANEGQSAAVSSIARFMFESDERSLFILKGYAGTGKTNLVSAITRALPSIRWKSVLLAPTGRAAKVFSHYASRPAFTIHKKIYRQSGEAGQPFFTMAENLHRNTLFIVDESSMIAASGDEPGSRNLLDDLFEYVFSGENCRLLLVGDVAQLPPVGTVLSPALDPEYLKRAYHLHITAHELREVARQRLESGILATATLIRESMDPAASALPQITTTADLVSIYGGELADALHDEIRKHGEDNVIILTRSNKQAGNYNRSYRNLIRNYEEDLNAGDRLMVVKNNYFWLAEGNGEAGFIANGDMCEITRITRRLEMYGLNFADCRLRFFDYPNLPEQEMRILTDCLYTDTPALTQEQQRAFYEAVMQDVAEEPSRSLRNAYVRKSEFYNALQVKFAYAITCHKAQGGQWPVVFIDQGHVSAEMPAYEHMRWLYTAITRASEKVYLVNFPAQMLRS